MTSLLHEERNLLWAGPRPPLQERVLNRKEASAGYGGSDHTGWFGVCLRLPTSQLGARSDPVWTLSKPRDVTAGTLSLVPWPVLRVSAVSALWPQERTDFLDP